MLKNKIQKSAKYKSKSYYHQVPKLCSLSKINKKMIDFCKMLSDPTRFRIVALLRSGAMPVQEIAGILKKTDSNISHQLRLLKLHGVVEGKRVAKFRLYDLTNHFRQKLASFFS